MTAWPPWLRVVVPILVGLAVGVAAALLPWPWPVVVVAVLTVVGLVSLIHAERELRRVRRRIAAFQAELDAYLDDERETP